MFKNFTAFFTLLWSLSTFAEDEVLAMLFSHQGIDGTIVISSLHSGKAFILNNLRANQTLSTASTFKILNTLISLEEKVISGKDDASQWDGRIYDFSDWNGD